MENRHHANKPTIVYWSGAVSYLLTRRWPQNMFTLAVVSKITKGILLVMEIWKSEKKSSLFSTQSISPPKILKRYEQVASSQYILADSIQGEPELDRVST